VLTAFDADFFMINDGKGVQKGVHASLTD